MMSWENSYNVGLLAYSWNNYREARESFETALGKAEYFGPLDPRRGATLNYLARTYLAEGDFTRAEPVFKAVLLFLENREDPEDLMLADTLNDLALVYESQGQLAEAEPLLERVLAIQIKVWSSSRSEIISVRNKLIGFYIKEGQINEAAQLLSWEESSKAGFQAVREGKYSQAMKYLEIAVKKAEKFGSQDPRLADSLKRLAEVYISQNKFTEAEPLLKRVLAIRMKILGSSHPETISARDTLIRAYNEQGKNDEVAQLIPWEELIKDRDQSVREGKRLEAMKYFEMAAKKAEGFGSQDVRLADSLKKLAGVYQAQGKFAEAERLLKRVLAIYEEKQNSSHPEVISAQNELGILYLAQGRDKEAVPLLLWEVSSEQGVKAAEQGDYAKAQLLFVGAIRKAEEFDPQDPRLAGSLKNLSGVYQAQGKLAEAEPLLKRVLAIRMKIFGSSHPETISARDTLIRYYNEQGLIFEATHLMSWEESINEGAQAVQEGKYVEAMVFFEMALKKAEEFGSQDPRLADSLKRLAEVYMSQNKFAEAEAVLKRVVAICEKTRDHFCLPVSLNKLAGLYISQNKLAEAESAYKLVLSMHETEVLGTKSTYRRVLVFFTGRQKGKDLGLAASIGNLAGIHYLQGHFAETERLFKRALAIRSEKLGPSHPDVITTQNELASLYIAQRRFSEAEKILNDSITVAKNSGSSLQKIDLLENYASLLQQTNRNEDAEKVIRQYTPLICALSDPKQISQRRADFQKRYCQ